MTTYYSCDGSVLADSSGAASCSTGWVMVSEPTWTLITADQAASLLGSILMIWAVWFVFQQIQRVLR